MPLVSGFSRGSPVTPALSFLRCSILNSLHPIGSHNLDVSSGTELRVQAPHRYYAQGVQCFRRDTVLCKLDPFLFVNSRRLPLIVFGGESGKSPASASEPGGSGNKGNQSTGVAGPSLTGCAACGVVYFYTHRPQTGGFLCLLRSAARQTKKTPNFIIRWGGGGGGRLVGPTSVADVRLAERGVVCGPPYVVDPTTLDCSLIHLIHTFTREVNIIYSIFHPFQGDSIDKHCHRHWLMRYNVIRHVLVQLECPYRLLPFPYKVDSQLSVSRPPVRRSRDLGPIARATIIAYNRDGARGDGVRFVTCLFYERPYILVRLWPRLDPWRSIKGGRCATSRRPLMASRVSSLVRQFAAADNSPAPSPPLLKLLPNSIANPYTACRREMFTADNVTPLFHPSTFRNFCRLLLTLTLLNDHVNVSITERERMQGQQSIDFCLTLLNDHVNVSITERERMQGQKSIDFCLTLLNDHVNVSITERERMQGKQSIDFCLTLLNDHVNVSITEREQYTTCMKVDLKQGFQKCSQQGEPGSIPGRVTGFSQVGIMPDDAVGLRVFSGISRFSHPLHSGAAPFSLQSPSSDLKTLLLRAAQISSLTHTHFQKCSLYRELRIVVKYVLLNISAKTQLSSPSSLLRTRNLCGESEVSPCYSFLFILGSPPQWANYEAHMVHLHGLNFFTLRRSFWAPPTVKEWTSPPPGAPVVIAHGDDLSGRQIPILVKHGIGNAWESPTFADLTLMRHLSAGRENQLRFACATTTSVRGRNRTRPSSWDVPIVAGGPIWQAANSSDIFLHLVFLLPGRTLAADSASVVGWRLAIVHLAIPLHWVYVVQGYSITHPFKNVTATNCIELNELNDWRAPSEVGTDRKKVVPYLIVEFKVLGGGLVEAGFSLHLFRGRIIVPPYSRCRFLFLPVIFLLRGDTETRPDTNQPRRGQEDLRRAYRGPPLRREANQPSASRLRRSGALESRFCVATKRRAVQALVKTWLLDRGVSPPAVHCAPRKQPLRRLTQPLSLLFTAAIVRPASRSDLTQLVTTAAPPRRKSVSDSQLRGWINMSGNAEAEYFDDTNLQSVVTRRVEHQPIRALTLASSVENVARTTNTCFDARRQRRGIRRIAFLYFIDNRWQHGLCHRWPATTHRSIVKMQITLVATLYCEYRFKWQPQQAACCRRSSIAWAPGWRGGYQALQKGVPTRCWAAASFCSRVRLECAMVDSMFTSFLLLVAKSNVCVDSNTRVARRRPQRSDWLMPLAPCRVAMLWRLLHD
ncbi:hypothetical protein PR048_028225 [Dryococelus australis]|uniref:Uncharacterized protein n=1 Tax=Dryococelus australis TaxID=614101 RepID=A0ABQ9GIP0_9NEOP|nr:hypothetical protein PR048_028225 [Dryococelus australis]